MFGSNFLLKIKAIRYTTYNEIKSKSKTYNNTKTWKYKDMKGE